MPDLSLRTNILHWFRADLRLNDNTALQAAIKNGGKVFSTFIICRDTWTKHHYAPSKIDRMLASLDVLKGTLQELNIPLFLEEQPKYRDCVNTLITLCQTHAINAVYFNKQYELDEARRDEIVINTLTQLGISCVSFDDQCITPPGVIRTASGDPYQVFTPFKRIWLEKIKTTTLPPIQHLRLKSFCQHGVKTYHQTRDFPARDATSRLSIDLTIGTISARECLAAVMQRTNGDISNNIKYPGELTWLSELAWRDFYKHIIFYRPDICRGNPYKLQTDKLPWQQDPVLLSAWKEGQTGFPLVDAAMRQLKQTGWMHNRLRMVTAMFFTKTLFLDWRLGEAYFMEQLTDGDFAANNGGWQWCASTGTDAVPYFRIFNPTTQSERFDPEGSFIRQYCPELSSLNSKQIHDPYARGVKDRQIHYPKPIIDYKHMRQVVIKHFKDLT